MEQQNHSIPFQIDKDHYHIQSDQNPVTGLYLRDLAHVSEEYDLWLRGRGKEDDKIILPQEKVEVRAGDHFYTSKKIITPGS